MSTISLGKIAFTWKGDYSSSVTYSKNDVVNYNGSSYICLLDGRLNITPTVISSWNIFSQGVKNVATAAGQIIYHNGSNLVALGAGTSGQVLTLNSSKLPEWSTPVTRSSQKALALKDSKGFNTYRRGGCIMTDGSIRTWGRGSYWVLGSGDQNSRSYPITVAFPPNTAPMTYFSMYHDQVGLSIDSTGKLWIWGTNDYGEVGRGDTTDTNVPYCASLNSSNSIYGKVVVEHADMSGSDQNEPSVLVRCSDGTVHACGYNGYGQLATGNTTNSYNFKQVVGLTNIIAITRGRNTAPHCLALNSDGDVWSWGYNSFGQLGHGNTTTLKSPSKIAALDTVTITKIGASGESSFAIDNNGNLYTWGHNSFGNLGWGGTSTQTTPTTVALTGVSDVYMHNGANNYMSTYAIKTDKTLWATGDNSYSCLGVNNDEVDRSAFTQCKTNSTTNLTNIKKVVGGGGGSYNFAVALDESGVAWSVGYSGNGQLGRGTFAGTNFWFQPVLIHRRQVVDICTIGCSSEGGTIFLLDDGQVYQTGYAGEAQLPEDDNETISVPMAVIF